LIYDLQITIYDLSGMTKQELQERFKQYAIRVAYLVLKLPYNVVSKNYADQLNRSASGAAANYRAALRAKSTADFLNKLKIVEEELDESLFFFELVQEINPTCKADIALLAKEGTELLAITVSAITTIRKKLAVKKS
jgi:four helix bundle protein